jgi:hypothetical protein
MRPHRFVGITHGEIDAVHFRGKGKAKGLFEYFISRQTNPDGKVNYGRPMTYAQIQREIENGAQIPRRTLSRWVARLREKKYIETEIVRHGRTVLGFTVKILNPKKWALQLKLPFAQRANIVEIGTGSRNRSEGKKEALPPVASPEHHRTVRHRLSGGSSTVEHRTPKAKAASSTLAPRSSALQTLENQRQKAARLEREIREIFSCYAGSELPQHKIDQLRQLRNELNLTRDVIHEYELRQKAVSA